MLIKCSWYPKKKIGRNRTFFRDNKGSDLIKKKKLYIALYFGTF